jgi:hypothetical protein
MGRSVPGLHAPTAARRWSAAVGVATMGVVLSGCVYDAGVTRAQFINDTSEQVVVKITGTDRRIEVHARTDAILPDKECVGDGVVFTTADGAELAAFDGAVCPSTLGRLREDGTIVVLDGSKHRKPA